MCELKASGGSSPPFPLPRRPSSRLLAAGMTTKAGELDFPQLEAYASLPLALGPWPLAFLGVSGAQAWDLASLFAYAQCNRGAISNQTFKAGGSRRDADLRQSTSDATNHFRICSNR